MIGKLNELNKLNVIMLNKLNKLNVIMFLTRALPVARHLKR